MASAGELGKQGKVEGVEVEGRKMAGVKLRQCTTIYIWNLISVLCSQRRATSKCSTSGVQLVPHATNIYAQ